MCVNVCAIMIVACVHTGNWVADVAKICKWTVDCIAEIISNRRTALPLTSPGNHNW